MVASLQLLEEMSLGPDGYAEIVKLRLFPLLASNTVLFLGLDITS